MQFQKNLPQVWYISAAICIQSIISAVGLKIALPDSESVSQMIDLMKSRNKWLIVCFHVLENCFILESFFFLIINPKREQGANF